MLIYYILFVLIFILGILNLKQRKSVLYGLLIVLILFAGLRGPIDKDYNAYRSYFALIAANKSVEVEPSLKIIVKFIRSINLGVVFLFLIYSFFGVFVKYISLLRISNKFIFYSILVYFSHYYFLMEMTQIRAGVAAGFILYSIIYIESRSFSRFLICILFASFFHYSALFVLPFYFVTTKKISVFYYMLIPIGYLLYFLGVGFTELIGFIHIDFVTSKYYTYKKMIDIQPLNVFNVWQLFRIMFIYILLFFHQKLSFQNKFTIILLKFYIFSCFFLVVFSEIPALGSRVSDLFGVVEIILVPFIFYFFKESQKLIPQILVPFIAFCMFLFTLLHNNLLGNYF